MTTGYSQECSSLDSKQVTECVGGDVGELWTGFVATTGAAPLELENVVIVVVLYTCLTGPYWK